MTTAPDSIQNIRRKSKGERTVIPKSLFPQKLARPTTGYGWNITSRDPRELFIGVAGIIGAGKTTLCDKLAAKLNVKRAVESVDGNPYLDDFYKDMEKYGFPMQVHLLCERFKQHQKVVWSDEGVVQDRTIYEDPIFARMLRDIGKIEERDYITYTKLFDAMLCFLRRPNIIVYLDVTVETALKRIKKRARDCEKVTVDATYLSLLKTEYEKWCIGMSTTVPVLKYKWDEPLETDVHYDERLDKVVDHIAKAIINWQTVGVQGMVIDVSDLSVH